MVPILNHSLFINKNNNIINVMLEIIKDIGLDNTILLYLKFISFIVLPLLVMILPFNVKFSKNVLILYSDSLKNIIFIIFK